ncbi:MAG: Type II secretory pathway component PulK-like protein, partial [Alteraurantiacibacter sp.]
MILINVLVVVMLATAVLALTIAGDDENVERSVRLRSAAEAQAIALGGELSAVTALRRDLARGNRVDTLNEEWALIGDVEAPIDNGTFTFAVFDAQARFNLANLSRGDLVSRSLMAKIALAAGLDSEQVAGLIDAMARGAVPDDFSDLLELGLTPQQIASLTIYCTFLPEPTQINLATAPEELLAVVLDSPARARSIV